MVPTRTRIVLALLVAINVVAFVDRQLPFVLAESIRRDLTLDDTQIGLIGGLAFALFYAASILPLAALADHWSAKWVLVCCVAVWSATTALGGLASGFWQLAATRVGVAVGEAASTPASHVIISQTWPPQRRAFAIGIFSMGVPLGIMIGLGLGGWLNDLASWRVALVLIGLPGLVLALAFAFVAPDTRRAAHGADQTGLIAGARRLFRQPSYVFLAAGITVFGIGGYAVFAFAAPFLIRVQGLTATQAGLALGLLNGVAGVLGALGGGIATDWLARRDRRYALLLPAVGFGVTAPLLVAAWLAESGSATLALLVVPALFNALYGAPCFATAQALAPPNARAAASAIPLLGQSLIGASLGPVLVGMISDALAPEHGVQSLRYALCWLALGYVGAALLLLAATVHLRRDLARIEAEAA